MGVRGDVCFVSMLEQNGAGLHLSGPNHAYKMDIEITLNISHSAG